MEQYIVLQNFSLFTVLHLLFCVFLSFTYLARIIFCLDRINRKIKFTNNKNLLINLQ